MSEVNELKYSRAIERLESIMNDIQSGNMDIDDLSAALKEADELVTFCRSKLYRIDEEVKGLLQTIAEESSANG